MDYTLEEGHKYWGWIRIEDGWVGIEEGIVKRWMSIEEGRADREVGNTCDAIVLQDIVGIRFF